MVSNLEVPLGSSDGLVSLEAARLIYVLDDLLGFSCCTLNVLNWFSSALIAHGEKEILCLGSTFLLQYFLQLRQFRAVFLESQESMEMLLDLIKTPRSLQIQYQAVFCFWIMTFEKRNCAILQVRYELIPALLDLSRAAVKEKIIRLCLACWSNFLRKAPKVSTSVMIGAKILDYVELLSSRKVADEEMQQDLNFLKEELTKAYQSLNSFDEYASEIVSGKLNWSPPHKSPVFWQENAARLEERNGELLKILTRLLTHSQDPTVLAVAANDLGEYIARRPQGRRYIEAFGTKQQLMHLMAHHDSEVRFNALSSVQKYMSNLWYCHKE